ncbi:MAG: hypothetical protein JWR85_1686 [Marmoricola sp.]|nr:hypothetical protein [Marmoricola sp.]
MLAVAVLGALLGALMTRGLTTYETSALMQITDSSQDSARIKQVGQTVERTATSSAVVADAAEARGESTADLTARLNAQWETDTDVVAISVRGTDPQDVVEDANAVVDSLSAFYDRQTRAQIKVLSEQGNELLASGRLSNADAEAARRSGIGSALAARQANASAAATSVSLLDSATSAQSTGLSPTIAIILGAFVGVALSAAAALLLPFRRRTVRRASEVPVLLPGGVRGLEATDNGAADVAGLFLESERSDLAVVAMEGTEQAAASFGADVAALLQAHGLSTALKDATEGTPEAAKKSQPKGGAATSKLTAFKSMGRSGRAATRSELGATALVLVTTATAEPLSLLSGQGEVMAVVVARTKVHSVKELEGVVTQLRQSDPTVVLVS